MRFKWMIVVGMGLTTSCGDGGGTSRGEDATPTDAREADVQEQHDGASESGRSGDSALDAAAPLDIEDAAPAQDDGPAVDSPLDATVADVAPDSAPDVVLDTAADVVPDTAPDATPDAMPDATLDAGACVFPRYRAVVLTERPVAYWPLDEVEGTVARDIVGSRDGRVVGGLVMGTPPLLRDVGASATFRGAESIEVPFAGALNSQQFTIELWARVDGGAGTVRSPFTTRAGSDTTPPLGIAFYADNLNRWNVYSGSVSFGPGGWRETFGPSGGAAAGVVRHLAASYDGAAVTLYVDGAQVSRTDTPYSPNNTRPLRIGAGTDGAGGSTFAFIGAIDEVALFDRALPADRVARHAGVILSEGCATGFADCDRNPANRCEVDIANDPSRCGLCGNACPALPNAAATCSCGACGSRCNPGFADCDRNGSNGCEVATTSSAANCGACGAVCPARANAIATCVLGACGSICAAGFADCDGDATNGCEVDTRSSDAHCGRCGNACATMGAMGARCAAGACLDASYRSAVLAEMPVAYWPLDEASGGGAVDIVGGRNGAVVGSVARGATSLVRGSTASAAFAGTGHIEVPFASALNSQQFTIELWTRVDGGAGTVRSPFTTRAGSDSTPPLGIALYADNLNRWNLYSGSVSFGPGGWRETFGPAGGAADGTVRHLAASYDGAAVTLYVDGAEVSRSVTTYSPNNSRPLRIGAGTDGSGGPTFRYIGAIDEVALFDRALPAMRIAAHASLR